MGTVGQRRKSGWTKTDYPGAVVPCRPATGGWSLDETASDKGPMAGPGFAQRVIAWQLQHGRHDLPWQTTRDPYRIWLSEIMLQQTQVTTVIPYYQRFLARFPDLTALASAPVEEVMAHWSGLGYYARARNLHAAAQQIGEACGGEFPRAASALATLPGIGRSTANAIAALAFGTPAAILDGNVKRVLARCFAVDGFPGLPKVERALWTLAETLLPTDQIEAYTQGLMDLGATVCTRARPDCLRCPLTDRCRARLDDRVGELPVPRPKKVLPERQLGVLLIRCGDTVLLERRPPAGIWGGLWSLPELRASETAADALTRLVGGRGPCSAGAPIRHGFTHFRLDIQPWECRVGAASPHVAEPGGHAWAPLAELDRYGLPTPIRTLLSR